MRNVIFAIVGVAAGFGIAQFFPNEVSGTSTDSEFPRSDTATQAMAFTRPVLSGQNLLGSTRGITRVEGYDMFYAYHRSNTLAGSQGLFRRSFLQPDSTVTDSAVVQIFLSYSEVMKPLSDKIIADGKKFAGFAAIPIYNDTMKAQTLAWMAVAEEGTGNAKTYSLVFPSNDTDATYIYDFSTICPMSCPKISSQLWTNNWSGN